MQIEYSTALLEAAMLALASCVLYSVFSPTFNERGGFASPQPPQPSALTKVNDGDVASLEKYRHYFL